MSGANKKLSLEEMADESLLRFNPQYSVPIRFPGPGDLEPNTYTSSRLTFAEDVQGGRESTSVLPRGDGLSLSGLDPLDTPAGSDSNSVDNAAVAAIKKKNKSSRTPSFFSRSYVAWKKVYDRGVYTPGLLVLPGEPSASPLSTSVCKRLKKLSVHEYLVLGNHLLRDHFDELTANFLKPQIEVFEQQKQHQQQSESDESKSSIRNATAAGEDGSARDASAMAARSETAQISLAPPSTFSKDDIEIFVQELVHVLLDIMSHNRHSMRIALLSIVIALIYLNMKGPPVVLVAAVMIIQIPDEEQINIWKARLRARINAIKESTLPLNARLAKRNAASASAAAPSSSATTSITAGSDATTALSFKPTANCSGVWKRGKVVNFEEFLVAQGVAYVQRKLAMSMVMVHTITMDDELTVFRLQEKGGPLVTDSTIVIGGDPVETELGPKKWLDTVSWEGPDCILLIKELLPDKNMEVQVRRRLINAGKGIRQDSFLLDKSTGKKVETTSFFDFEGSSPNDKPATVLIKDIASAAADASTRVEAAASGDEAVAATSGRRDLSGVWTRERTHNVDAYVGAQGAGFVQRKMAASMAMVHTLTMNADLSVLRLQEVGGPLNSDIVYTVDSDPMDTMIMKRKFKDTCTWVPGANPPTLKIVRKHEDDDFSLVLTRYIEEDGGEPTLVLVGAYVDHATKQEIVGTSWFKKTASTPNPPPTSSAVNKKAKGTATPASTTAVTSAPFPANSPAAGTPVEGKASTSSVDGDDGKLKRNLSTLLKVDLSGVWEREGDSTTGMLQFSQSVRHTITMDPPFFSTARIEEKSGPVDTDYSFDIDSEYIPTEINGRRFMERCYWEGEALVQKRVAANDYELVMMRYLEDAGGHAANSVSRAQSRLRFVTIKKNLKTGEETESSQFFKRVGPSPRSLGAVNKGTGTSKSNSSQLKSSVSFGPNEEIPDVAFVDYTTAASNDV